MGQTARIFVEAKNRVTKNGTVDNNNGKNNVYNDIAHYKMKDLARFFPRGITFDNSGGTIVVDVKLSFFQREKDIDTYDPCWNVEFSTKLKK